MDFDGLLGPQPNVIELHAENRWEAIDELVAYLAATHKIKAEHKNAIAASVRKRESSMTTGIGFGFGLPHCSTDLVSEVVAVVGRSKKGIRFDSLDLEPVNLVILFLMPEGLFQTHVNTLANIAKLLHQDDFRERVRRRFL
jgi:mannitol/fructose-specific phosphotransferase system IIA component (Ntr-type)